MSETRSRHTEFLWNVHTHMSNLSKFFDAKLAFVVVFAATFLGFLLARHQSGSLAGANVQAANLFTIGSMVLLALSIAMALMGFGPRDWWIGSGSPGTGIIFWTDIVSHGDGRKYWQYVGGLADETVGLQLSAQVVSVASVVDAKFYWLRASTAVLLGGAGLGAISVAITTWR